VGFGVDFINQKTDITIDNQQLPLKSVISE
jgi:hypothetical protein